MHMCVRRYRDAFESLQAHRRRYATDDEHIACLTSLNSIPSINNYLANACEIVEREKVSRQQQLVQDIVHSTGS